jgi:hypothetical protein
MRCSSFAALNRKLLQRSTFAGGLIDIGDFRQARPKQWGIIGMNVAIRRRGHCWIACGDASRGERLLK